MMDYVFKKIDLEPAVCEGVVLTTFSFGDKIMKEKMTQIMFEVFEVQNLFLAMNSVMSLYSCGRTTGLVVGSGADVTFTVPAYEGFAI
jgi:actin, other eukaryote